MAAPGLAFAHPGGVSRHGGPAAPVEEVTVRGMIRNGVALGVIALLAAACGSSTTTSAPSSSATTPSNTSGAGASTTGSFKACMVTDTGGINDKSFNQAIYQGILAAAAANPKITTKYLLSTTTADYASNITAFLNQKCGIIVTNGFLMGAATQTAAKANPSAKFSIVDFSYAPPISNVDALVYNTVQDGFLGGYLAAGMTKTGKVATFGGQKLSTVTIYMDGFWDGVQYYNKQHHTHVQVLGWSYPSQKGTFVGSFTATAVGQTIAN